MRIHMLFGLLEWKYDQEGAKDHEFSENVTALGVRIDLSQTDQSVITINNTNKRR